MRGQKRRDDYVNDKGVSQNVTRRTGFFFLSFDGCFFFLFGEHTKVSWGFIHLFVKTTRNERTKREGMELSGGGKEKGGSFRDRLAIEERGEEWTLSGCLFSLASCVEKRRSDREMKDEIST